MLFVGQKTFRLLHKEYYTNQKGSVLSKEELKLKVNKMKVQRAARRIEALEHNKDIILSSTIVPELKCDPTSFNKEEKSDDIVSLSPKCLPLEQTEKKKADDHNVTQEQIGVDKLNETTFCEVDLISFGLKRTNFLPVTIDDGASGTPNNPEQSSADNNNDDRVISVSFLKSKGIEFDDLQEVSNAFCNIVANRMREVQATGLVQLKRDASSADSDDDDMHHKDHNKSDSSDDDEDIDIAEALEAYRYLESLGLVLTDLVDVNECIKLATLLVLDRELLFKA
jgi:hypothetical protein